MLNCIVLSVADKDIMLGVIMLSVIMLSAIMLSVIMLSVIMLSVIMLSVGMLNVDRLSVMAPYTSRLDRFEFYFLGLKHATFC